MKKKYFSIFLFTIISVVAQAQQFSLSDDAQVSILTMGPGTELYDSFGHSGFRIKDANRDVVYNYGVYDFDTPNFYTKFAQGKLLYEIGKNDFIPFYNYYASQNRWIQQQTLNLTYSEKQALYNFLENNLKPENKKYKYDFFYDNCATKIRDVLKEVLGEKLDYNDDFVKENKTFRALIQQNLETNSWGSMGIDVALGAVIDRKATAWEYQYLPDYVKEAAETATLTIKDSTGIRKAPLVLETKTLFSPEQPTHVAHNFFTSPLFIFSLLALVILFVTYRDVRHHKRSRFMDATIFGITGSIGFLLLLLWFATDHTATANNYNLLWAFPINLLLLFSIASRHPKKWMVKYIFFLFLMLVLLTVHWISGVQRFSITLIPLFIALGFRYAFLIYFLKKRVPQ